MARIKNYSLDTTITGGDKLVGTDVGGNNATKSYQIETIAQYFSKTGSADGTQLGYQYNYAGTYLNNAIHSGEFRYQVNPTAPSQYGWANITGFAFSRYNINRVDIAPIVSLFQNQIIKITDISDSNANYGTYEVSNVSTLSDAYLFSLIHKGSFGEPTGSTVTFANTALTRPDKFFTFVQSGASATWTIEHNLEKFPSVTVIDSANNVVYGNTTYTDENNLIINFSAPFSGKAYLN